MGGYLYRSENVVSVCLSADIWSSTRRRVIISLELIHIKRQLFEYKCYPDVQFSKSNIAIE